MDPPAKESTIATIPGRFPIHERSNSAPGSSSYPSPPQSSPPTPVEDTCTSRQEQGKRISTKRASSAVLPDHIAGLIFAAVEEEAEDDELLRRPPNQIRKDEPPAVPPKSPRLAIRLPATKFVAPGCGNSPAYTPDCTSTPASAPVQTTSPEFFRFPSKPFSPGCQVKGPASIDGGAPSEPFSSKNEKGQPNLPKIRNFSHGQLPITPKECNGNQSGYKCDVSEGLSLNRGRTPKLTISTGCQNGRPQSREESPETPYATLPSGLPANAARKLLPHTEVDKLYGQARQQVQRFEVLKYHEVKMLSRVSCALHVWFLFSSDFQFPRMESG